MNGTTDFDTHTVYVSRNVSDTSMADVLAHELSHIVQNVNERHPFVGDDAVRELLFGTSPARQAGETEAELSAAMVLAAAGVDDPNASAYVADWTRGDDSFIANGLPVARDSARQIVSEWDYSGDPDHPGHVAPENYIPRPLQPTEHQVATYAGNPVPDWHDDPTHNTPIQEVSKFGRGFPVGVLYTVHWLPKHTVFTFDLPHMVLKVPGMTWHDAARIAESHHLIANNNHVGRRHPITSWAKW